MNVELSNQLPCALVKIINREFQEKFNATNKHRCVDFSSDDKAMHAVVRVAVILQVNAFARLRIFELGSLINPRMPTNDQRFF